MINVFINETAVKHKVIRFNGGEIGTEIKWASPLNDSVVVRVFAIIKNSDDIMELLMITDAIKREVDVKTMTLEIPYLPYARQDRVCSRGEPLSVKVMTDLINSMNYDKVVVFDCHSDVGIALLNSCVNVPLYKLFNPKTHYDAAISPDAGANKKTFDLVKKLGINNVIRADKIRDVSTGKITETKMYEVGRLSGFKSIIVADDICDGGRTFVEIGKIVRDELDFEGVLDLVVTHGIFSKGKDELLKYFNIVEAINDWTEEK